MHTDVQLTVIGVVQMLSEKFAPLGVTVSKIRVINPEGKGELHMFKFNIDFLPYSAITELAQMEQHGLIASVSRSGTGLCVGVQSLMPLA